MTQVIIYPNNEGWLSVVSPAAECGGCAGSASSADTR
jgi:hypothetical protein